MEPTQYVKALVYRDLGIFSEPLDKRRKMWKKQVAKDKEEEPGELGE